MHRVTNASVVSLLLLLAASCGRQAQPGLVTTVQPGLSGASFAREFTARQPADIAVDTLSMGMYRSVVAREVSRGHIVVVNFWATWCDPCVEEFPDLMRLQRDMWDEGVRLITISVDTPPVLEDGVKPFLFENRIVGATYLMADSSNEDFLYGLSDEWFGSLPQTFVYNLKGEIAVSLTGMQSLERFRDAVNEARTGGGK
jgi:thiol-disulfide isomerase/thioredoxin